MTKPRDTRPDDAPERVSMVPAEGVRPTRPSPVPILPPAPPERVATPALPQTAARTMPPAVPPFVQAIDHLGDIAGAVCALILAMRGLVSGELALAAIVVLVGSQNAIRKLSALRGGQGLGTTGTITLAMLALGLTLVAPGSAAAAVVAAGRISQPHP